MAQQILLTNDARQTLTTILGTQKVRITLYYLSPDIEGVEAGWYVNFSLFTDTELRIVSGQRLVSGGAIASALVSPFTGVILAVPITNPVQDLKTLDAWTSTHNLIYFTPEEVNDNFV